MGNGASDAIGKFWRIRSMDESYGQDTLTRLGNPTLGTYPISNEGQTEMFGSCRGTRWEHR
jgi:hypothetical protein